MSEKIHDLFESFEKKGEEKGEEKEEEKGAIDNLCIKVDKENTTKRKKNITYRAFRQNEKSHRYTFKHF